MKKHELGGNNQQSSSGYSRLNLHYELNYEELAKERFELLRTQPKSGSDNN